MEDFLGTLIYIIIAIAGIIVSIFNKKSKEEKVKQEFPEFDEEPVYRTSDNYFNSGVGAVDEFFAQHFPDEETSSDKQEEPDPQEEDQDAGEKEYVEGERVTDDAHEQLSTAHEANQHDSHQAAYKRKNYNEGTEKNEPIERIINRFKNDPRQAVILSEILNRKEY